MLSEKLNPVQWLREIWRNGDLTAADFYKAENALTAAEQAEQDPYPKRNKEQQEAYERHLEQRRQAEQDPSARYGAVKVRELEWVRGWMDAKASSVFGDYRITYRRDGSFEWAIGSYKVWAPSWDNAKAAAQLDYEKRILSAIEPVAMTGGDFLRVFKPLPEDELAVLREVDPDTWGHPPAALEPAEPATDAEPVVDFLHGMPPQDVIEAAQKVERYFSSKGIRQWELYGVASRGNPHPPESRLREALEKTQELFQSIQHHIDEHSYSLAKGFCSQGEFVARAALAQEDGR